jgi:hypothetical protein
MVVVSWLGLRRHRLQSCRNITRQSAMVNAHEAMAMAEPYPMSNITKDVRW